MQAPPETTDRPTRRRRATRAEVNDALGGHLDRWLAEQLARGATRGEIRRRLRDRYGLAVPASCIDRWCRDS